VKDKRPVNLDFTTFKLPLPAITSITHRITGCSIFFGVAILLYLLDTSLQSEEGFNQVASLMDSVLAKLIVWLLVSALLYHLFAGIKHLIMDLGVGETIEGGLLGARIVIVLSAVAMVIAGVWIW
jgi:succinate dehydrogenase / fumarate reductase cytochrome b subunit